MGGGGVTGSRGGQFDSGFETVAAEMSMRVKAPGFTSSELELVCELRAGLTLVWPGPTAVASPKDLTVATALLVALQSASIVTSCWVPSVNAAVATYWRPPPDVTEAVPGAMLIPLSWALLTFSGAEAVARFPWAWEKLAEILAVPGATPVASSSNPLA